MAQSQAEVCESEVRNSEYFLPPHSSRKMSMESNKRRRIGDNTRENVELVSGSETASEVEVQVEVAETVEKVVPIRNNCERSPTSAPGSFCLEQLPTELLTEVCDFFTVLDYYLYTRTSHQLSKIPGRIPCVEVGERRTMWNNRREQYAIKLFPRRLTISPAKLIECFPNFLEMNTLERFQMSNFRLEGLQPTINALFSTSTSTSTCSALSLNSANSADSADVDVQRRQLFPHLREQIFATCPGSSMLFNLAELGSSSPTFLKIGQDDMNCYNFGCPIHISSRDRASMKMDQLKKFEEREQKWLERMHTLTRLSLGGSDFMPSWDYPSVANFPNLTTVELELATLSDNNRDTFEQLQQLPKLSHLGLNLIANTTLDPQLESKFDAVSGERSPQMPHADGKFLDAITQMKALRSLKLHLIFDLESIEDGDEDDNIINYIDHSLTIRTVMSKVYAAKQLTSLELLADDGLTVDFFPQAPASTTVTVAVCKEEKEEDKQFSAASHIQQLRLCQPTKKVTEHQAIATALEQFTTLTSLSIFGLAIAPSSSKLSKLTNLDLSGQSQNGIGKFRWNPVSDLRSLKCLNDFSGTLTKVVLPFTMGKLLKEYAAAFCAMPAIQEIVIPVLSNNIAIAVWQEFIKLVRVTHPNIVISHY